MYTVLIFYMEAYRSVGFPPSLIGLLGTCTQYEGAEVLITS